MRYYFEKATQLQAKNNQAVLVFTGTINQANPEATVATICFKPSPKMSYVPVDG